MAFLKELPAWFDLANYQVLTTLTPGELKAQIEKRVHNLACAMSMGIGEYSSPLCRSILDDVISNLKDIWCGNPCIEGLLDNERFEPQAVEPTSSEDAVNHYLSLKENGYFSGEPCAYEDAREYFINNDIYSENRKQIDDEMGVYTRGFSVNIDLGLFTDKEILEKLKVILPDLRKKTRLNEPKKGQIINQTYKNKVLKYEVIPLIDLVLWQVIHREKISRKVLLDVVYKDFSRVNQEGELEPICDNFYDERIRPFVLKCVGDERLDKAPEIFNIFKLLQTYSAQ